MLTRKQRAELLADIIKGHLTHTEWRAVQDRVNAQLGGQRQLLSERWEVRRKLRDGSNLIVDTHNSRAEAIKRARYLRTLNSLLAFNAVHVTRYRRLR